MLALLPWQPNEEADHHNYSYFELPLPKQLLYQIIILLLQWFQSCHLKKSFFKIECCRGNQTWPPVIKHINWVNNHQMIITAKYGSNHFTGYRESAIQPFSHYKCMGAFCCHGNQTKRQTAKLLAILNCPMPSNISTKLESYCFNGFGVVI